MPLRLAVDNQDGTACIGKVANGGTLLTLTWSDGAVSRFNAVWLRHNAQDSQTVQLSTGQKHIDIEQLDPATQIVDAHLNANNQVEVTFAPDGHHSIFDPTWLFASKYDYNGGPVRDEVALRPWGSELGDNLPSFEWPEVANDAAAKDRWYRAVVELGFAILHQVPAEKRYVEKVVASFGKIKESRLGKTFDVKCVPDPSNLAFTAKGLSLHTDNPYRNPVPGLQLLHCLQNSFAGGESVVADGFKAADLLREENSSHYDLLSSTDVQFRYKTNDAWFEDAAPLIALDRQGRPKQIRYNNRSMLGPIAPVDIVENWYDALRHFAEILRRSELNVTFKMDTGDLFIVDNHRVLHARTAFCASEPRLLEGAYAELDWMESRYRLASSRRSKVATK
ncbi:TauD/TfdA family dioxygenase [Bradyrhizobium sp. USDA 336]|uniref:TauD/TfdA family dioxygenase n=1 Tax=Bradyrhizobium sp. USDA 336 TaxID=3156311 RepID=UPI0038331DB7